MRNEIADIVTNIKEVVSRPDYTLPYQVADQILALPAPGWVVKCGNLGNECNHEWALANCVGTLPIPDRCIRPATLKELIDGQGVRT